MSLYVAFFFCHIYVLVQYFILLSPGNIEQAYFVCGCLSHTSMRVSELFFIGFCSTENIVVLLLEHGASLEARNRRKETPLMCSHNLNIAKRLVPPSDEESRNELEVTYVYGKHFVTTYRTFHKFARIETLFLNPENWLVMHGPESACAPLQTCTSQL